MTYRVLASCYAHMDEPIPATTSPISKLAFKNHLAVDRTSCHEAATNQFQLFLHAGAYWLMWSLRHVMPRRSA